MSLPTAPNTIPITPQQVLQVLAVLATACTDKTGGTTTYMVALVTALAGGAGGLLSTIRIKGTGTTTLGSVLFFLKRSSTYYLIYEAPVAAVTSSATNPSFDSGVLPFNVQLQPGDEILAATTITQGLHVSGNYGEY